MTPRRTAAFAAGGVLIAGLGFAGVGALSARTSAPPMTPAAVASRPSLPPAVASRPTTTAPPATSTPAPGSTTASRPVVAGDVDEVSVAAVNPQPSADPSAGPGEAGSDPVVLAEIAVVTVASYRFDDPVGLDAERLGVWLSAGASVQVAAIAPDVDEAARRHNESEVASAAVSASSLSSAPADGWVVTVAVTLDVVNRVKGRVSHTETWLVALTPGGPDGWLITGIGR